jgi:hypothetical protein
MLVKMCVGGLIFGTQLTKLKNKAMPWLRRLFTGLSPRRSGFTPESVHMGFVVDKVAFGQVILIVFRDFPPLSFHRSFSILIYHVGIEQ